MSVCLSVCVFKHFRVQRPNGWSDRDWGSTDRRAETPERHWCRSRVGRRHVARGTCRRVKVYQKFSNSPIGHTPPPLRAPLIPNSQVTRVLHYLKIHWGCRFSGVPAARARGEEAVLTWGPPVKVNFELATPNSVHGCTLARPTWRRMKKRAGLHCARAVHVQMFCTCSSFAAPKGQTVRTADAKLAGHMYATPAYMYLWLPILSDAGCARQ